MTAHPIPAGALDDRLGFVGTSGSGKTYNAGSSVERLLAHKARVVIIDPLGVWWGLRLDAGGKAASRFDVVIFGGPHGDLPLNEHAGALLGETAATMAESCIVDISQLGTKAAERRFMTAFLENIYRKAGGAPLHLVVDEADLFAPQKPAGGDETLLGLMEQIVRRGRVKGFIPWLITQRPAVINKNVLSQVDGLVAFKLTSSQDRDALDAWIEGQADKAEGKAIKDALPTLQVGTGVIWVPGRGVLDTRIFPRKATFDSSRAPKRGEKKPNAKLRPLDVASLEERLAAVVAQEKENNPKALRAEVQRLQRELGQKSKSVPAAVDPAALEKAEQRGFEQARKKLGAELEKELKVRVAAMVTALRGAGDAFASEVKTIVAAAGGGADLKGAIAFEATPAAVPRPVPSAPPRSPSRAKPVTPPAGDGTIPGNEQRILNSLATWRELGHDTPSNAQVAWLANYSPTSTSYTNPRGALRTKGLVTYPAGDCVALTDEGVAVAIATPPAGAIANYVLEQLPGNERRILEAAIALYPNAGTNEEIATAANYSPASTSYTNPRGALRTKELVTYPSSGQVRAADWLFTEAA